MTPDEQGIFYVLVVGGGPGSGEFVYDANAQLRSSNVGQATTDPVQGASCPQGFATFNGHGAVINLLSTSLGAFFQYFDNQTNVQGPLVLSVASVAGNDPVNNGAYPAGLLGVDPAFGDTLTAVGAHVLLGAVPFTSAGSVSVNAAPAPGENPSIELDAPEQGNSGHLQMLMQGSSPDGTRPGQLLIGPVPTGGVLSPASVSMMEVQGPAGPVSSILQVIAAAAGDNSFGVRVTGEANNRLKCDSNGAISWGPGGALTQDTGPLSRQAAGILQLLAADLDIATAGKGLRIKEGANAKSGVATLGAGTVVVSTTAVTATSRIQLTAQDNNSAGALRVSARTAGTSFTITSSNAADSGVVAWVLIEPG